MLRRELAFDGLQTSLKFAAYWLSGSQAMKAEFMRASVDCLNHITLYKVNGYAKRPPDAKHNYGYERYRNLVTFLPSALFFSSGMYNVVSQLDEIWTQAVQPVLTLTAPSLTVSSIQAIVLCSFGEVYLFHKNLGDIQSFPNRHFLPQLYLKAHLAWRVLTKRHPTDPIQLIVVSENVTSVLGMSVPLISSFLAYFTGWNMLDQLGCILNGSVQIYLAWSIFWDNSQVLIGKSLSKVETLVRDKQQIKTMLEDRDEVAAIEELKSEYVAMREVKIAATVKYDLKEIAGNVLTELEPDIREASVDPFIRAEIRKLVEKSTGFTLTYTTEIIQNIENDVRTEFPYIVEIDLEQSKDNIIKEYAGLISLTSDEEEGPLQGTKT